MKNSPDRSSALLAGSLPRAVLLLAGPMFISSVLQNAQSLIDLYWVGRLGPVSVAALALSGAVLMALFPVQMGLATGTVALVSRAYGAGDARRASAFAAQSLSLGVGIGLLLGLACLPWLGTICTLLGAEPDVTAEAIRYLRPSLAGMSLGLVLFLANSAMQASGNTVVPMAAMLAANLLNLVLDPLFIFGWGPLPGFGVAGAAWATLLAQALAALGLLLLMVSGRTHLHPALPDFRPVWRDGLSLLRIGLPSMAQMSSRSIMGLVFFRVIARFGTFVVAGYGIGMRWHMVLLMPCFVLANAAATLVGQNLGAGQPQRARRAAWCSTGLVLAIVAASVGLLFAFTGKAVALFDQTPEVVAIGSGFLRVVSPFYLLAGVSIVLDRALNGAGCTVSTMLFTIVTLWGLQVPLAFLFSGSLPQWEWTRLFSRWFDPPVQGVWWAMNTATALHAVMSVAWFSAGRWMHKRV